MYIFSIVEELTELRVPYNPIPPNIKDITAPMCQRIYKHKMDSDNAEKGYGLSIF